MRCVHFSASPCGTDWLFYGGFCFYFTKEYGQPSKLNWFAARQWCHSNGGDLASVHDDDTNDFLTNIVSRLLVILVVKMAYGKDVGREYVLPNGCPSTT